MSQQTFAVGKSLKVVITGIDGSLSTRVCKEQMIGVEMEGSVAELRQEGGTLIITDCKSALELELPLIESGEGASVVEISVTHLSGSVALESVERVELKEIGGNVTLVNITGDVELENVHGVAELTDIGGNLRAENVSTLHVRKGVGGNASLSNIPRIEIDVVGSRLLLNRVGTAEILAVGGDLEAEGIEVALHSTTVGADCWVRNSTSAEISISNVADTLHMEGIASGHMSVIGEDLHLQATFPAGTNARFHVGGNASVTLPADASLNVHAIVGGEVSGNALGSGVGSSFVDLVYGNGAAKLDLLVEGDLTLLRFQEHSISNQ